MKTQARNKQIDAIPIIRPKLAPWQALAVYTKIENFCLFGGIGSGKTFSGAQMAIFNLIQWPGKTGFIGANTYDQLNQATLREFFYWLDHFNIQYTFDRRPPEDWNAPNLKSFKNVICCKVNGLVSLIFTRGLSDPDTLRGIEFTWYWIDESRDTREYALDVIIGRLRESDWAKGLVTTSTHGEDWVWKKFYKNADNETYGCAHVATIESVRQGFISERYYKTLLKSYSPEMIQQELFAQHINLSGGRAYYSHTQRNRRVIAPWGEAYPNKHRELLIGCDFNYSPAPCMWGVAQRGPMGPSIYKDRLWYDHLHVFDELVESQIGTPDMVRKLVSLYPGFHYAFYGDASGGRGTNSNAGVTDYRQIAMTMDELGCSYSISVDDANPRVRDRVETVNSLLKNGLNEVLLTYNHEKCPELDSDFNTVGWRQGPSNYGRATLNNNGDLRRTHITDGIGYLCEKLFPLSVRSSLIDTIASPNISNVQNLNYYDYRTAI